MWDFLKAAFPAAIYCLCSATMTDEAITDVQSMYLAGRGPANSGTMLRRVTREEEEERVEQSGDEEEEGSDTSVASNVGSLLGCLEIE